MACWYIGLMMLFIPFPFSHIFQAQKNGDTVGREAFPQQEVGDFANERGLTYPSSRCTSRRCYHCSRRPCSALSMTSSIFAGGTNCQYRSLQRYRRYWSTTLKGVSQRSFFQKSRVDGCPNLALGAGRSR